MAFALSYPVNVRSFPTKGFDLVLDIGAKERRKLADNHGLLSVDEFSVDFHLRLWKRQGIKLQGHIKAFVTQKCIITAESIKNYICQSFEVIYVPRDSRLAKFFRDEDVRELFLNIEGPDAPEIFEGKEIDIGAVAEEFFELSIDPYPRNQGALLKNEISENGGGGEAAQSPFPVLECLKRP
ncbi:MAG: hypothetical protein JSC189_000889 [Candidatus Tokpelaia sp. JSC189]|nr:MAG: hypothetical protein JSC189_000889 [Candidatus Tokpelaia sp. JSC189]